MINIEISLLAACKDFFGPKEGQSNMEFMQEFKKLSKQNQQELHAMLTKVGYKITAIPA